MEWFKSEVLLLQSASFDLSDKPSKLVAIQAKNHEALQYLNFGLAINIASMQEMNPDVISSYFSDLRQACSLDPGREFGFIAATVKARFFQTELLLILMITHGTVMILWLLMSFVPGIKITTQLRPSHPTKNTMVQFVTSSLCLEETSCSRVIPFHLKHSSL